LNVNQIAIRRWYEANTAATRFLTGGNGPRAVAFDGTHIWAANGFSASVTKLRASDGAVVGTFPCGNLPWGIAFDGTNIWVANLIDDTVTKLRASDGLTVGTYSVGRNPIGVAFDGANIWVCLAENPSSELPKTTLENVQPRGILNGTMGLAWEWN